MCLLTLLIRLLSMQIFLLALPMRRLTLLMRSPALKTLRFYAKLYLAITRVYLLVL